MSEYRKAAGSDPVEAPEFLPAWKSYWRAYADKIFIALGALLFLSPLFYWLFSIPMASLVTGVVLIGASSLVYGLVFSTTWAGENGFHLFKFVSQITIIACFIGFILVLISGTIHNPITFITTFLIFWWGAIFLTYGTVLLRTKERNES